jgi:hypothetical protein
VTRLLLCVFPLSRDYSLCHLYPIFERNCFTCSTQFSRFLWEKGSMTPVTPSWPELEAEPGLHVAQTWGKLQFCHSLTLWPGTGYRLLHSVFSVSLSKSTRLLIGPSKTKETAQGLGFRKLSAPSAFILTFLLAGGAAHHSG